VVDPGVISWIGYGWETSYGTVATTVDKALGHGVKITSLTRRNNIEKVFSMGTRNAQALIAKKYEGALTTEHVLCSPWFFEGVLGSVATTGTGPYTHTFSEADTTPSLSFVNNIDLSANLSASLLGAKVATCSLTSAVNELVRVRMDMPYANESFSTTTTGKLVETLAPMTFAHGLIEAPNGTTLSMVQNFECTIANNPELVAGQGSRVAQAGVVKNREYSGSITMALQAATDLLHLFAGGSTGVDATSVDETARMEMTFKTSLEALMTARLPSRDISRSQVRQILLTS